MTALHLHSELDFIHLYLFFLISVTNVSVQSTIRSLVLFVLFFFTYIVTSLHSSSVFFEATACAYMFLE